MKLGLWTAIVVCELLVSCGGGDAGQLAASPAIAQLTSVPTTTQPVATPLPTAADTVTPIATLPPTAVPALTSSQSVSTEALAYLDTALDIMQANSIYRDRIDWDAVRTRAHRATYGARTSADTYRAIQMALREGEAIAVAFRGRSGTRSFGQSTGGLSTANQHYPLSDGAWLLLTVSTFADRTGQVYGQSIAPDQVGNRPQGAEDLALQAAIDWLLKQPACTAGE
jgi:hypothetical protein